MSLAYALQDHTGAYLFDNNDLYIYDHLYVAAVLGALITMQLQELDTIMMSMRETNILDMLMVETAALIVTLREINAIRMRLRQIDRIVIGVKAYD